MLKEHGEPSIAPSQVWDDRWSVLDRPPASENSVGDRAEPSVIGVKAPTDSPMAASSCRFCDAPLSRTFVDLGVSPLANAYLRPEDLTREERFYPLHAFVCDECLLVQLEQFVPPEDIFSEYAYFSSYSDSFLRHAEEYANKMIPRLGLSERSQVLEIASNDGYLLQYFIRAGIPVLGVDPAANVAKAAREKGIPTVVRFFGTELARLLVLDGFLADLVIANNVLAHVPQLNDFIAGMKIVLNDSGVITVEFPHLLRLIEDRLFDTIYHEHIFYFSLLTVERIFRRHGLVLFDVQEIDTHGGSLRIFLRNEENTSLPVTARVEEIRRREVAARLDRVSGYEHFAEQVRGCKRQLLSFLIEAKRQGKSVVGYGAPAKAITLLNYCGVGTDFIDYTVDRSPHKQGHFLPGTRIPIYPPERIRETRPDYVLILPWNLRDEIIESNRYIRHWGGRFVIPIAEVQVYE